MLVMKWIYKIFRKLVCKNSIKPEKVYPLQKKFTSHINHPPTKVAKTGPSPWIFNLCPSMVPSQPS
jgi:hypothetical protein